jgi:broad specificity phosphatase PhoE
MMDAIYLVRHGQTNWNQKGRLQGILDVGLNHVGVLQSLRLAKILRQTRMRFIFSSPLSRACGTAGIIGRVMGHPVIVDNNLREIDHGAWSGMMLPVIARRYPEEFAMWQSAPDRLKISDGETLKKAYQRASRFLLQLIREMLMGNVLVVSHGVSNAMMLCAALGAPRSRMVTIPQPNLQVHVIRFQGREVTGVESL